MVVLNEKAVYGNMVYKVLSLRPGENWAEHELVGSGMSSMMGQLLGPVAQSITVGSNTAFGTICLNVVVYKGCHWKQVRKHSCPQWGTTVCNALQFLKQDCDTPPWLQCTCLLLLLWHKMHLSKIKGALATAANLCYNTA